LLKTTCSSSPKSRMSSTAVVSYGRQVAMITRPTDTRSAPRVD
jgi:hypothetical protein